MAHALRSTIDKWDLIEFQSFCKAKDTVNRTKQQPTDWEKIFTNPTSNRWLISNIYKEEGHYSIFGGTASLHNHSGNQSGGSSENWT